MKIEKVYFTPVAKKLLENDELYKQACNEVINSITSTVWPIGSESFIINASEKNVNGVVPLKERCYIELEESYLWYREKPLHVLKHEKQKGGPIDVYKEFSGEDQIIRHVGLEFETGNISSAHRSMNKLLLGLNRREIDLAMILMPIKNLSYYLTDRVANYEELEPYFENANNHAFIFLGFNADHYSYGNDVPIIPKGKDGMSSRSIRKW